MWIQKTGLIDTERHLIKIQHPFKGKKPLSKLKIEGNFPNLKKASAKNPTANSILNNKRLDIFPSKIGRVKDIHFISPF